ncbi:unnamed protein product, partial [Closterium sp. NIES-53]
GAGMRNVLARGGQGTCGLGPTRSWRAGSGSSSGSGSGRGSGSGSGSGSSSGSGSGSSSGSGSGRGSSSGSGSGSGGGSGSGSSSGSGSPECRQPSTQQMQHSDKAPQHTVHSKKASLLHASLTWKPPR